jgi:hypothetical protein
MTWAAVADPALAAVAMTSPTAAIAAVSTPRRFNASDSLRSAESAALACENNSPAIPAKNDMV